jgi:hypothetical protein
VIEDGDDVIVGFAEATYAARFARDRTAARRAP